MVKRFNGIWGRYQNRCKNSAFSAQNTINNNIAIFPDFVF
jgi:hypothetical protein